MLAFEETGMPTWRPRLLPEESAVPCTSAYRSGEAVQRSLEVWPAVKTVSSVGKVTPWSCRVGGTSHGAMSRCVVGVGFEMRSGGGFGRCAWGEGAWSGRFCFRWNRV